MQVQCIPYKECSQCPFGELITLPCELTEAPSVQHEIQDFVQNLLISEGQRKVILEWKHTNSEAVTYYNVTVKKVTGEFSNFATNDSSLTLFLSYSAYNISLRGINSAGSSPAATIIIQNTEGLSKVFQPYKRYNFILHTRPYKDTCNMKNVNDSERTYGTSQAYLTEGSPITSPGNVSILNITKSTSLVTWSPVSEEDLRGFLLGYIIYYTEDNTEEPYKVDPSLNSYVMQNLKFNTAYRVQLSAFTAAGEGERSDPKPFVTNPLGLSSIIAAVIVGIIIFLVAFQFSCRFMQRAKKLIWPSIPNPGNSNAVQKIEIGHELDILEPLNRQKLEESEACDSSTVCVVESRKEASPLSTSPTPEFCAKPTVFLSENECSTSSLEETTDSSTSAPNEESAETENAALSASVDNENNESEDLFKSKTDFSVTVPVKPAVVFMSDYTTMEFFQQVAMTGIQGPSMLTGKPGLVSVQPGQDYVRQTCFAGNEQSSVSSGACNGTDVLHIQIVFQKLRSRVAVFLREPATISFATWTVTSVATALMTTHVSSVSDMGNSANVNPPAKCSRADRTPIRFSKRSPTGGGIPSGSSRTHSETMCDVDETSLAASEGDWHPALTNLSSTPGSSSRGSRSDATRANPGMRGSWGRSAVQTAPTPGGVTPATALIGRYGTTPASSPKPGPYQGLAPTYSQSFSVLPGCTYSRSHTPLDCARRTDLTPWRGVRSYTYDSCHHSQPTVRAVVPPGR
ncbi:Contactin-1 Neural cell recognition molecule F11 [Triplophysa tibetana]|uniref:Contactin-1 Neural cell recognition molecule F11 n=1 Tax=Triplophysa tibetana TaxID=1572043 RepID=A0A5A9P1W5_9TELE|nr:Contactin-1 Neural cell recognition molecule F11 [Triplophysa tibetana]